MSIGITIDTGALIALERNHHNVARLWSAAHERGRTITVPTVVIAEWWRGNSRPRERILGAVQIEPLTHRLAQLAGEAMALVKGSTVVDAIVAASAAQRGDVVFTSDYDDLERLRGHFTAIARVLRV